MSEAPTERSRVKRYNHIAKYDKQTIHGILDAMPLCHIGFVYQGTPFVTPTLQWREGERVYWHGSAASRMLETVEDHDMCLTVTLFDGLVMTRSAYNYNINHRSVMIFGKPDKITDVAAKEQHLRNFVNKTIPGQWERLRPVSPKELKATTLLSMSIDEASCKVRTGPPEDDEDDYSFPVWAGVIPVRYETLPPIADARNLPDVTMPEDALKFRIG